LPTIGCRSHDALLERRERRESGERGEWGAEFSVKYFLIVYATIAASNSLFRQDGYSFPRALTNSFRICRKVRVFFHIEAYSLFVLTTCLKIPVWHR
jgi:hypothetical protein